MCSAKSCPVVCVVPTWRTAAMGPRGESPLGAGSGSSGCSGGGGGGEGSEGPLRLLPVGPCVGAAPLPLPSVAWVERARKELHEDPATARRNINALRRRVQEERTLRARTDDTFLLAFLRARKHNVEDAFKVLKNFYRLCKQYPSYTEHCLPSEKGFVYDQNGFSFLAERDQLQHLVICLRVEHVDLSVVKTEHFFQQLWTALQAAVEDPLVQVAGVQILIDFTGFSLRHAALITPSFARLVMKLLQDSFPVRVQGIHMVHEPFYFDAIYMLFRPFIKAKLRDRMCMHGSSFERLHQCLGERCLPQQLGGCADGWGFDAYRAGMASNEPLFRLWRQYGYGKKPEEGTSEGVAKPSP